MTDKKANNTATSELPAGDHHQSSTGDNKLLEPQLASRLSPMDRWVNNYAPVDIDLTSLTSVCDLSPLRWLGSGETPKEMFIGNTGYTLNVSANYSERRPSLTGSALRCPYHFWCFHFHWGAGHDDGSEHRIMGKRFPMEIHLMFYNVSYKTIDEALIAEDGILRLVYVGQLMQDENLIMKDLISESGKIESHGKSVKIDSFPLSSLFDNDLKQYFMYWSTDDNDNCVVKKKSLWIISPKPVFVNNSQLSRMRSLKGFDGKCIVSNCRLPQTSFRPNTVFSVGRPELAVTSMLKGVDGGTDVAGLAARSPAVAPETTAPAVVAPETTAPAAVAQSEKNDRQTVSDDRDVTNTIGGGGAAARAAVIIVPAAGVTATSPPPNDGTGPEGEDDADSFVTANDLEGQCEQSQFRTLKVRGGKKTADDVGYRSETTDEKSTSAAQPTNNVVPISVETKVEDARGNQKKPLVLKTHRDGVRMTKTALRREFYIKSVQDILKQKTGNKN